MAILSYAFNTASSYVFRPDASTSLSSCDSIPVTTLIPTTTTALKRHSNPRRNPSTSFPSSNDSSPTTASSSSHHHHHHRRKSSRTDAYIPIKTGATQEGEDLCDLINLSTNLYEILGVPRKAPQEHIRRAFLSRSRLIHPDKLPLYLSSTPAFQRLSFAYETLSKSGSRRMYDLGGGRHDWGRARTTSTTTEGEDETLNGVLRSVFAEFLEGDFEMIRVFVNALNEGNPGLNLGDEAVDNLEGAFRRVRESLLAGQKYMRLVKFELIRLYELQHLLRSLSYFDLLGRMRLTLALTRVTLEIPMVLDKAMREEVVRVPRNKKRTGSTLNTDGEEDEGEETELDDDETRATSSPQEGVESKGPRTRSKTRATGGGGELQRRGLLGPRVKGVLIIACKVLEKGERFGM